MKQLSVLDRFRAPSRLMAAGLFALGILVGRALHSPESGGGASSVGSELEEELALTHCETCRARSRELVLPVAAQRVALGPIPATTTPAREFASNSQLTPAVAGHTAKELLSQERSLEAYGILSSMNADSSDPYLATALALARQGHSARASEMFEAALEREAWGDDDMLTQFVKHDAQACLDALDREVARQVAAGVSDPLDNFSEPRAQALQALGRASEAVLLLDSPEEMYAPWSGGCTPAQLRGSAWMWAAWAKVDPRRVEAILERAESEGARNLIHVQGRLLVSEGRFDELDIELERIRKAEDWHNQYGKLLIDFAPERGWDTVRDYLRDRPLDRDAVWAYGDHLLDSGRSQEATDLWHEYVVEQWEQNQSADDVAETIARLPSHLLPSLDTLVHAATGRVQEPDDLAYELASLGDVYWMLGKRERAMKLWREALAHDPDCGWLGYLRQAELGIDPFGR